VGAGGVNPLVLDLGICLVISAVFGVLFERLRIPSIAALLVAGVIAGPIGLSLVHERHSIDAISNLGLTLLLFVIGLEIKFGSLVASGRTLLVSGLVQVPLTVAIAAAAFATLSLSGWGALSGAYTALYLGVACAFSSTLLVVKLLQEKLKLDSVSGRLCVGLLIFQDVWAIVFLALQPNLAEPDVRPIALTFLGIAILVALAMLFARYVLPVAFRVVAKVPELVVTLSLGWCFGLGIIGSSLGAMLRFCGIDVELSVSMEMGALIAGASLAASPYAHEVVAKVSNLRDFFVTLFFVGLGMSIPAPEGFDVVILSLVLSAVAVATRYFVFLPLLYYTGLDRRNALDTATKLAQISEFCLVIAYLGHQVGHLEPTLVSAIIFAFVVTALATPQLFRVSDRLYDYAQPLLERLGFREPASAREDADHEAPRIVILGFHRIAAAILHELKVNHPDVLARTLVIDINVATHERIRELGAKVLYGDISSAAMLEHAKAHHAEIVLSTVSDELLKNTTNARIAQTVRSINPDAALIVHATRLADVDELLRSGATDVFVPPVDTAAAILPAVEAALNGELEAYMRGRELVHGDLQKRRHALD
jgi:Kef-type K+ transport system membrane component KefB